MRRMMASKFSTRCELLRCAAAGGGSFLSRPRQAAGSKNEKACAGRLSRLGVKMSSISQGKYPSHGKVFVLRRSNACNSASNFIQALFFPPPDNEALTFRNIDPMLINLKSKAASLPLTWKSALLGKTADANLKILRMDNAEYEAEVHSYAEALIVIDGCMKLSIGNDILDVSAGEMFLVPAGLHHGIAAGSSGTLLIVDPDAATAASLS